VRRRPVALLAHDVERAVLDLVVDAISWMPPSSRIAIVIELNPGR